MRNKSSKDNFIQSVLDQRKQEHQLRTLSEIEPHPNSVLIRKDGKELINFCSNDYLGLAHHPEVIERSIEFTRKYGAGSGSSRLVSGTLTIHQILEEKLAQVFDTESALIFNSGFQANTTIIPSLADRNSLVLMDKKCHNSLIQGALLSKATFKRYEHNNYEHLEQILSQTTKETYNRILIVSETVFSMDGDQNDLNRLLSIAEKYNAMLYSDDAHALGVLGKKGLGLNYGKTGIDIKLGTFGKSFGSFGAFLGCSTIMRDYLINKSSGFIYTTSLPPSVIGALDAALDLIPDMEKERAHLSSLTTQLRNGLIKLGLDVSGSESQIVPAVIGKDSDTVNLSNYLEKLGFWAQAIRPPTVEKGKSRIRFTVTARHNSDQVKSLLEKINTWLND